MTYTPGSYTSQYRGATSDTRTNGDIKNLCLNPAQEFAAVAPYKRRILLCGFSILALSVLVGIFISFYEWDRGSPFDLSNWGQYNALGGATYGTLAFALLLFPVTVPVLLVLSVLIYFGIKRQRLWPLSLLGFLGIGLLWIWYVIGVLNFN